MFEKLKQSFKGLVDKISKTGLTEKDLEPLIWELQLQLISNDVSVQVAERICDELKTRLIGKESPRFGDKLTPVKNALKESIEAVMVSKNNFDLVKMVNESKSKNEPFSIMFVGINGTGKTTTIAKFARLFMKKGFSVVMASGDTYRAGAIEQLEEHARRLEVKIIKHQYGSDSAAVGFDAMQHAKAKGIDIVLIDTAGRMQTNRNLMDELTKIKRVVNPNLTIMILDSLIGNDATEQAKTFNDSVGFDATVLTKVDADAKGGASLSVSYLTNKPVIYIGIGQGYDDLQPFDPGWFAEKLIQD
ncbi:signal recognition particle-docking protein FtsY [Candidatus Bathyarchaeota archaeon]|nr:signal recognition particle-docking protein FtsY [Candidatus Bathyarchaeota archaeon]